MNLIKTFLEKIKAAVIIFSLLNTSLLSIASAQSKNQNNNSSGITSNDVLQIMQAATGVYSQYIDFKSTTIMQQIQAQKNQEMMQSLSPNCRKADGTSCFTGRGKFFPECPIPASMTNFPQNVCSSASPNPNQISSMITYESIGKSWVNYYDQMLNEASNMAVPFGLKCLQDKQKAMDSQLTEMVNNLTRLQDQLNKDKETFKANNKKLLADMTSTFDELNGSTGKNNLNAKAIDFAKYFSPSCQSVIGEQALAAGKELGLIGVRQSLSGANKRAADFNSNRTSLENEMRADVEKMQKSINDGGLSDYLANMDKQKYPSKFKSLAVAADKKSDEFKTALDRINGELREIGYEVPKMGKGFSVDFDKFLASSQTFFKKKYVNDCVSGADQSGIALTTQQILDNIQQKSTKSKGNATIKYKEALASVLKRDISAEEKLKAIQDLEKTYVDMSITYNNNGAEKVTETPYDLYMRTLEKCNQKFTQEESFSSGDKKGLSYQTKVARGQELLREIKGLHDNYASSLAATALNQALSCNGESKKAGANCSSPEAFDHTRDSFCINHAYACANEVNGCYAEAEKHVELRKAKMENLAKAYNANVEGLIARSNTLYNQQKAAVMDMVKNVQARFPGTNFLIPEGMFVSMPEMSLDQFGVPMANNGDLKFMDELPKKIELLKDVFKVQQTKVKDEISDYIGKQTAAMNREKARWEGLIGECKSMIDTSSRELAKMNAEGQKNQQALDQKVANFCMKYAGLKENPVPACEDAKSLAEDAMAISNRLTNEAVTLTRHFRAACNGYMNEKDIEEPTMDESDCKIMLSNGKVSEFKSCMNEVKKQKGRSASSSQPPKRNIPLSKICNSESTEDSEFIKAVANQLDDTSKKALEGRTSLSSINNNYGEEINDNNFFETIQEIAKKSKSDKSNICAKLSDLDKEKESTSTSDIDEKISLIDQRVAKIKKESEDAESKFNTLNIPNSPEFDAVAFNAAKKDKEDKEKALKSAQEKAEKEKSDLKKLADSKKPEDTKALLKAALKLLQPRTLTRKDEYAQTVQRIGEQTTNNCDARATSAMPKLIGTPSILPPGFDTGALTR